MCYLVARLYSVCLAGVYMFWSVSSSHFKGFLILVCADKSEAKNNYVI